MLNLLEVQEKKSTVKSSLFDQKTICKCQKMDFTAVILMETKKAGSNEILVPF